MRVRYFYAIFVPERTTFLKTGHKLITDAEHPLTFKHKNKHHEHDNRTNKQNERATGHLCFKRRVARLLYTTIIWGSKVGMERTHGKMEVPEVAKNGTIPWPDILGSLFEHPERIQTTEECCSLCHHKLLIHDFRSPSWTWTSLCGRGGMLTFCPNCLHQENFSLDIMN